ncbi:hypothetical protein FOZ76_16870 [Verticiella sediminum]|uniref:DUF6285 domain-containing protein n=1 Tax=Verticiella sediminum TaxID=1247510 RepID=A0A556AJJ9_9BURK|nr:DUF6285 domain-containing protein [Verticiella sediminum]TSH93056.1 hypothetical protein FOZ76_16870 [Verticiella sediminum]
MSVSIPSTDALLAAVITYLEQDLLPGLEGYHRFQTRVAANALKIVLREQRLGTAHAEQDAAAVADVLGRSGAGVNGVSSEDMADALRDGKLALDAPGLAQCLREMLRRQLAVDSPAWVQGSGRRSD